MTAITVSVTTNGSGDGSALGDQAVGLLYAIEYQPGTIATGATLTLTCESDTSKPLLTKASAGTSNSWYYPRDLAHGVADGAALTDRVIPIFHGKPKVTIASGGDTKTGKVIFYVVDL